MGSWLRALASIVLTASACAAHADALRFCQPQAELSASQQDKLFRFGALIKAELDGSGQGVALIARSGLDLARFDVRYSHAGLSLKASENAPWSVRQLYYACDEQKPRLYDQGIAGFVLGLDAAAPGYVSIVLLPAAEAVQLEHVALDKRQALQLLATSYSANAYPFSQRYQNCNQWVVEMLAAALGAADDADNPRREAQRWLSEQGYAPSVFALDSRPLMWAGAFIPWLHSDDHPPADIEQLKFRVSMPASIEAFVHSALPGARRIELCHDAHRVVIHRGWEPIAEGCLPGAQDQVIELD